MNETGVKINYDPYKEIVVMQKNRFSSVDNIARFTSIIAGGKTAGLYWAEGIVFVYFPVPASTEIVAKLLIEQKTVYWTFIGYAFMPKYQSIIETKEKIMVPVINMGSNPMFKRIAVWIKEQEKP
jgi:hypothetical protein